MCGERMPLCGYEGRDNIATYGTKKRALPRTAGGWKEKRDRYKIAGKRDEDYYLSGKTTEHSDNKIEG